MVNSRLKKINIRLHRMARHVGIRRHEHEYHRITLRRLILLACMFSILIVGISSYIFYKDPRSKYDLVRPGRRELPESFKADEESTSLDTKDDVKLEIQRLQGQLKSLDSYGSFNSDSLSDGKVLQSYLDQPVLEQ